MIDLIIPYYNNRIGLLNTLKSVNQSIFKVTIVDDHSTETPIFPLDNTNYFRLNINSGPGVARQQGIEKTSNPYIMFLDTGDIFISHEVQKDIAGTIAANPNINIFSFSYYYKDELTKETDNRLHGKVYKRDFLKKYGITFAATSSYLDEDIGFNRTCRYCTEAAAQPLLFFNSPVIKWIENSNSLTQKDNGIVLYRDQTRALSLTSLHTIDILRSNDINPEVEINQIGIALYYWFIRTAAERPTYMQDAWTGAKIFYDALKEEIDPNKLLLGNNYLKKCLQYRGKIKFSVNILRFAHDILQFTEIPKSYIGGNNNEERVQNPNC